MRQVKPRLSAQDEGGDQLGSRRRELQARALMPGGDDEVPKAGRHPDVRLGVDAAWPQPRPDRLDLGLAERRAEPKRLVQQVADGRRRGTRVKARVLLGRTDQDVAIPARDKVLLAVF